MPPIDGPLASVRSFFDRVLNAGDLSGLEALFHRDVVVPQATSGLEGLRSSLEGTRRTFGNPQYKAVDTISEGGKVVVRFSAKATHSGSYLGIGPTGMPLNLWGVMIFRFEAGAIAEYWCLFDAQSVLTQIRQR